VGNHEFREWARMGRGGAGERAGRKVEDVEGYGLPNDDVDDKNGAGIPNDKDPEPGTTEGAACVIRRK
jgi:hypothetical protein